jgi:hypothetical protein
VFEKNERFIGKKARLNLLQAFVSCEWEPGSFRYLRDKLFKVLVGFGRLSIGENAHAVL